MKMNVNRCNFLFFCALKTNKVITDLSHSNLILFYSFLPDYGEEKRRVMILTDIVVAGRDSLEFYVNNGQLTHREHIPSSSIISLAYDPVHNSVLFVDRIIWQYYTISSFDIATRKIINLYKSVAKYEYKNAQIAYDPTTELLFWSERAASGNLISSKPAYTNAVEPKLLIKFDREESILAITVDSCGGYIYWGTNRKIERARFDGSEREVVIDKNVYVRDGIAIDQQIQKIYWINSYNGVDYQMSIESADLNGENRRLLYMKRDKERAHGLAVTKDFIYWRTTEMFSQLTKNPRQGKAPLKEFFLLKQYNTKDINNMASNYTIDDLIQNCQKRLLPTTSETNDSASLNGSTDVSLLCVHGTKVSGESRCECTQGYIGERCEVSVCHNYCLQGDCSVSAEGQPKCRCNAGYSGERCEVTACSTPTIVTDAASNSTVNDTHNIISQELNNTLKRWRTDDMDAMAKFMDDIKGTLRVWREEIEISIQSKLNDSIKCTLTDKKQEMNSLRCSEDEKLKEYVRTHDVSELKSSVQFQAAEPKELKERVDTIAPHSSEQSQKLVRSPEQKIDSISSK